MPVQSPFTDPALPQTAQRRLNRMHRDQQNMLKGWGWADWQDTQYTLGSPFAVAADTPTAIPNNGIGGRQNFLPVPSIWDAATGKFVFQKNDSFVMTIEATIIHANAVEAFAEIWLDVGAGAPVENRYLQEHVFHKGPAVTHRMVHSFFGYADDDMAANGGIPTFSTNDPLTMYDIRFQVQLLFREDTKL